MSDLRDPFPLNDPDGTRIIKIFAQWRAQIALKSPLPPGPYIARVIDQPTLNAERSMKSFTLTGFQPVNNDDSLTGCGDFHAHKMTYTFKKEGKLLKFLDHLGIEKGDRTIRERLADAPGKQCKVTIVHSVSKNQGGATAKIKRTDKIQPVDRV
jgi:hypothetical protein